MLDLISKIRQQLLENASDDMKLCIAAGVPMEYTWDGNKLTMTTKYPVAIARGPSGGVTLFVQKGA